MGNIYNGSVYVYFFSSFLKLKAGVVSVAS